VRSERSLRVHLSRGNYASRQTSLYARQKSKSSTGRHIRGVNRAMSLHAPVRTWPHAGSANSNLWRKETFRFPALADIIQCDAFYRSALARFLFEEFHVCHLLLSETITVQTEPVDRYTPGLNRCYRMQEGRLPWVGKHSYSWIKDNIFSIGLIVHSLCVAAEWNIKKSKYCIFSPNNWNDKL